MFIRLTQADMRVHAQVLPQRQGDSPREYLQGTRSSKASKSPPAADLSFARPLLKRDFLPPLLPHPKRLPRDARSPLQSSQTRKKRLKRTNSHSPLAKRVSLDENDRSFFQITGTACARATSRKITETKISGVFWIRPLVGVHGRPSRAKDPR
jgi:hypothetical protein